MTSLDLDLHRDSVPAATTSPTTADRLHGLAFDYGARVGLWAVVVVAASIFPIDHPHVARVALFIHLISMAVGFGAVVMVDVYGLMWLFGNKTLAQVVELATVAHNVIALAVGGLMASGIALRPDLSSPLAQFKMVLVLVLMLNGAAAQRMLRRMKRSLPPATRGANIPWAEFQRLMGVAMISQSTWWGAIAIGFITSANRHS
jgi:hypothetical protein